MPLFFNWELWYQGRELTFLGLVSVFVLGLQGLLRVSFEAGPILPASLRTRLVLPVSRALARLGAVRWLPFAIVVLGWVGYTIYFSVITLQHHFRLETMGWDLGIENNLVWNAAHFNRPLFKTSIIGGPESTHLGFHETYISYLMGIFYRLAPRPQTLLVYQAAVVGGAALPLYAFARRHVGDWTACLLSILLLMYAPLQGSNLYDFHYLPFAPFFLWWCLWALESRRNVMATIAVILTLANREDMSALLMVVGIYLLLTGERPRAGLLVAGISAVYFVVVKLILMPHFLNGYPAYINQYEGLLPEGDTGFGGVLKTVFANPAFTMTNLLERDKLVYVLEIIAPLAFFPWRRPIALLCVVPGFIFTMLATHYPPLIQISFQYTAYWTSFLFIAIVANLAWIRRERGGWLAGRDAQPTGLVGRDDGRRADHVVPVRHRPAAAHGVGRVLAVPRRRHAGRSDPPRRPLFADRADPAGRVGRRVGEHRRPRLQPEERLLVTRRVQRGGLHPGAAAGWGRRPQQPAQRAADAPLRRPGAKGRVRAVQARVAARHCSSVH